MPSIREHTDGVIAALEDADLIVGDGVGDGDGVPGEGGWQGTPGESGYRTYVVVRRIPGGRFDGTLADPNEDASLLYEVKAIGPSREAAERAADTARVVMFARPSITDRVTLRCQTESDTGVMRDDAAKPKPLFYNVERFRLDTTPA